MATIRAKDLPNSTSIIGVNDWGSVDDDSSGETRKFNINSIKNGLGLSTNRVTVTSLTSPTPDFVGQPGIDTQGKTYVAISLSGTMWEEAGGTVDNTTLQKSAAGVLSVKDAGVTFAKIKKALLSDQHESDTSKTEIVHNISSYSFPTPPFVLVSIKSGWGVYVKSVTTSQITLGVSDYGVGDILYDLLMIYQ